MKHICIDARMLGFSGIGTYLANILPLLLHRPHKWTLIVAPGSRKRFPFLHNAQLIETTIAVFSLRELLLLHRIIPPCDLYWMPHYNGPLVAPQAKKMLLTLADTYHCTFQHKLKWHQKLYVKHILSRCISRADAIITVSDFSKGEIARHFPHAAARVHKIYNAVASHYCPEQSKKPTYFLFVGSDKPHKNLSGLLEAFTQSLPSHNAELYLCGSCSDPGKPRVHALGHVSVDALRSLYQNALALVFPSHYEGFGLPPLEAMACGCPTIVARSASLPEVCGDAALYVPPGDPAAIAEALTEIANTPALRKTLSEKGLRHAQTYTWQQSAHNHLALFDAL